MPETETVERRAHERPRADPDPVATPAHARRHRREEFSDASGMPLSRLATGSGIAVMCAMEGAWLWLLVTGAAWLLGGE
jgi:hypothetical protein